MSKQGVREAVLEIAASQDGVLSRAQARAVGADRWLVHHEVEHGRWQAIGDRSIAVHPLELSKQAQIRVSVWEAAERAVLDGASSLQMAGLRNFDDGVHILCPWPNGGRSWNGSRIHNSRLWNEDDFVESGGIVRTRNDVATVRAAMYARSDRAAGTVMAMAVQQGLADAARVLFQATRINRHRRRPFIMLVAADIADGARALGELDFAGMCRARGLPAPTRQLVRRGPRGRVYLDVYWDSLRVVIEIEGIHHDAPENIIDDSLRQNALTIGHDSVLRVPVLGLRVCPELFMGQVEQCLTAAGWRRSA